MGSIIRYKGKLVNKSSIPKPSLCTRKEREFVFNRDGNKCVKCGRTKNLTIDHIIPKSKGGRDNVTNYQTMCFRCNQEKKDLILPEYIRV